MRASLAGLMALIALLGVCFAGLRHASDGWALAILLLTATTFVIAACMALAGRSSGRAFWAGFCVSGVTYLAVASLAEGLPTTRLLDRLHPSIRLPEVRRTVIPRSAFDESYSAFAEEHPEATDVRLVFDEDGDNTATIIWGVPTLAPFRRIGHCIIALALALFGGTAAGFVSRCIGAGDAPRG
jgi:hypothetical protein